MDLDKILAAIPKKYIVYAYGHIDDINTRSFLERCKEALQNVNVEEINDIQAYANGIARTISKSEYFAVTSSKKENICPLCKEKGIKSFMVSDSRNTIACAECTRILNSSSNDNEIKLRKVYASRSKALVKCETCSRLIPKSHFKESSECPFECGYHGNGNDLEVGNCRSKTVRNSNELTETSAVTNEDTYFNYMNFQNDLDLLRNVISSILKKLEGEELKSFRKILMMKAYLNCCEKYPKYMVAYLIHHMMKVYDGSIQSKIFQEFISLVENSLPFTLNLRGVGTVEIYSLLDPNLRIFSGISEFQSVVHNNGTINNETVEHYIGGRNGKNFGPCYIGKLISVKTLDGTPIKVDSYSFRYIKTSDVPDGTPVFVNHYRIPSHSDINGMEYLQKARNKIVDRLKVFRKDV